MKYVIGILSLLILGLGYYSFSINKKLTNCKEVPDFKNAIIDRTKFVGYEKAFHFKLICKGRQEYNECETAIFEDITGESITLKPEKKGKLGKSSYVVDWVEKWNFFVDLSNSSNWKLNINEKKIIFNCPKIEIEQIINPHAYIAYVKDRSFWDDDEDRLLKLAINSSKFSKIKTREYLEQKEAEIQKIMRSQIKKFFLKILDNMGYGPGYEIVVNFK